MICSKIATAIKNTVVYPYEPYRLQVEKNHVRNIHQHLTGLYQKDATNEMNSEIEILNI